MFIHGLCVGRNGKRTGEVYKKEFNFNHLSLQKLRKYDKTILLSMVLTETFTIIFSINLVAFLKTKIK